MNEPELDDRIAEAPFEQERPIEVLLRLAARAKLFRAADGRLHARVPVGDRHEIYGLRSAAFRDWLIDGYFADQNEPASDWAIRRVVGVLEARARFDGGAPSFFIRVGRDGDGDVHGDHLAYFLDLGDASGMAVMISADGWSLVDQPRVQFRRPAGHLPLPIPRRGGSVDLLRRFVNLSEVDFRLMIAWITMSLRPVGPYPILVLHSQQNSAKTTLCKVIRLLIDPQACPVLHVPNSIHDMLATALNGWLLAYDNVSSIPTWLSDGLCQLVYGAGFAGRALFSNDERSIIYAQRPVLLSGIDNFVKRGDLRDRCAFLHPPMIDDANRLGDVEFWNAFHADYPLILGSILDAVVGGLRELPSVHLTNLPRMADFAIWGEAVARAMGFGSEQFLSTYNDNRKEAVRTELEESPLGTVMLAIAAGGGTFSGSPSDFYASLTRGIGPKGSALARWPKTISQFSSELRHIAPQLLVHGLSIEFSRNSDRRVVTVKSAGRPNNPTPGGGPNT